MSKKKKFRQFKDPEVMKKIDPIPIQKNSVGCPSNYPIKVKPFLDEIKYWVINGMSNKDIAIKLDISMDSFCDYQNEFSEFSDAIKMNRVLRNKKIYDAIESRALGYEKEETKEIEEEYWAIDKFTKLPYKVLDKQGNQIIIRKKEKVKKHIPSDTRASTFILANTDKENWKLGSNTSINVNNQNNNVIQNNLNLNDLSDDDLDLELKKLE